MPELIIELQNASVYHRKNLIISDINLTLEQGEFVYLIGRTGSGKSSFMRTIYGDIPLRRGKGEVVGYALHRLRERQIPYLRRRLGIVFQDFKLLSDRSVYENLSFVLKATGWKRTSSIDDRIEEVLSKVDMLGSENKLPHQLSGGEQQRVSIARALLNEPELILADEPTGNLDPQTGMDVLNLLKQINKLGCTVLMSTHNYFLISKLPSRTIRCENSKIFEVAQETF